MTLIDPQLKSNDCGISAIKTIYNLYKIPIDRQQIQQQIYLNQDGSRLKDLKDFFEKEGFKTAFKLLDINYLQGNTQDLQALFPFILPIEKSGGLHYVVVNSLKNGKLEILDPSKASRYFLSLQELKAVAHFSKSTWEVATMEEKLSVLCHQELASYQIDIQATLQKNDNATLFNKLTYFGYLKNSFGFKNAESEKAFLEDLLFNQQIASLPKHFKTLKYNQDKIRVKAPLALSVKPPITKPTQAALPNTNIYLTLFKQLGQYRKLWFIYVFAALFSASTTQLSVFVNQILIDHVLPSYQLNTLIAFGIGLGIFKLFDLFTSLYKSFVGIHVGNILDRYFLMAFDEKINSYSLAYIQSFKKGDLAERLSDSLKLKAFFLRFFTRILVDCFVAFYSLAILFYIHWRLSLLVCVVMTLYYIWFRVITPFIQQNERLRFSRKADFFSKMLEKLDGVQVIKSFGIQHLNSTKIYQSIKDLLNLQIRNKYIDLLNISIVSVISIAASLLIVVFLTKGAIQNSLFTLGQIITFIALSDRVFSSLRSLLEENLTLQENEVILKRYLDFEENTSRTENEEGISNFKINSLNINGLNFGYFPDELILSSADLSVSEGEKIKIEGSNGSGKSTLGKILTGLYPFQSGQIEINGLAHKFYNTHQLRKKILLVTNEDILFNETIEFNVAFGSDLKTEKILILAKKIQLYDFIASKEDGLDFVINENGKNLSTGQRKKILVMRALLAEAEIVILDEVLSGIDADSRQHIENHINSISDKAFIVISHEAITHINFSKIYQINHGKLGLLR